ncbi:MAG: hypothetical protein GC129_01480 [Proteobacteria bacterium]|nr:hypothetical protein [Pseudomonadota bacterium]
MAEPNQPDIISRPGMRAEEGAPAPQQGMLAKFRGLPKQAQIAIVIGGVVLLFWMFSGSSHKAANTASPTLGTVGAQPSSTEPFSGLESDRPAVMQNVYEQNRREMSDLRNRIEDSFQQRDHALQDALSQNQELQRQMTQMMSDFTAEIKNLQLERAKDADRLAQLADQQHQMELNSPVEGGVGNGPVAPRRQRINQVTLGGAAGPRGGSALLSPFGQGRPQGASDATDALKADGTGAKLPFMPPLGFVKATLLNGVDALVGGTPTPALARVEGVYKTAMGSTVSLDGCFVMVEFNGNISTERAVGKPARMTCVYPDRGAATYSLSGYVVDADDGIIGVPGMLYEGDPTRIAASMLADFAAGIGEVIAQNQQTTTVDSNGTQQNAITGSQAKAEVAGGVNKAMSSLRDYLMERVNRVQPFIRLDATRQIHLVILNGTELRAEGSPWSLLFDAQAADAARASGSPADVSQATGQQQTQ